MKVLVTGANGLLGHHVVFQLLKNHHQVRIILRGPRDIYFDTTDIESVNGDFTEYETLKMAANGCDAIIHIAAVTSTDLLHYDDYRKVNLDGSATVIGVANDLNINRLVFVSTANTIGFGTKNKQADETSEIQFPFSRSFYAQSKVEAEKLFKEASLLPNRHVIIVNPSFLIGAYDGKPSSGKLMLMGFKKPLMAAPRGGKNFVAASDVATAICNALTMGRNGERYLASGVNLSFSDFYKLQKEVANYRQAQIQIPYFLLTGIGFFGDFMRKLGIKTEICTMNLRQLRVREYYSNAKAKAELAMPVTELQTAIAEAIGWFKDRGMAK